MRGLRYALGTVLGLLSDRLIGVPREAARHVEFDLWGRD